MKPAPRLQNEKKDGTIWVVVGSLCLLTLGLIGVTWFAVSSLQDNSEKLKKYKTTSSEEGEVADMARDGTTVLGTRSIAKTKVHVKSAELSRAATKALYAGRYQEAISTMRDSIKMLKHDMAAGKEEGNEEKLLGARYAIITVCYLKMKDGEHAIEAATESLKHRPDNVFTLNRRSDGYTLAKNFQEAAVDRTKASEIENRMKYEKRNVRRVFGDQDEEEEEEGEDNK